VSEAEWKVLVPGYINPLAFTEVEEPWTLLGKEAVTDDELRRYLCEPGLDYSLDAIVGRFKEISVEGNDRIFMSPEGILGKIIWPLRHSKASYALGNYLGAIALCGMVAEMAALLCFESFVEHSGIRSKRSKPAPKFKKHFEPKKFERYRQTERIKALDEMGLVPAEAKAWFHEVRVIRNRHLHLMSQSVGDAAKDAVSAFLAAVKVVKFVLGLGIAEDGRLALRPEILTWMEVQGHRPSARFMFGENEAAEFARRLSGSIDPA